MCARLSCAYLPFRGAAFTVNFNFHPASTWAALGSWSAWNSYTHLRTLYRVLVYVAWRQTPVYKSQRPGDWRPPVYGAHVGRCNGHGKALFPTNGLVQVLHALALGLPLGVLLLVATLLVTLLCCQVHTPVLRLRLAHLLLLLVLLLEEELPPALGLALAAIVFVFLYFILDLPEGLAAPLGRGRGAPPKRGLRRIIV